MNTDVSTPKPAGRPHIFVANGSPEFLEVVRLLLLDGHYHVTATNFLPETFDQIAVLQPAVLVIDLAVGRQAGWDLLARLHAEAATRQIPVLVTSTDARLLERAQVDFARYGGQAFLARPMDLEDLLADVRSLIRDRGPDAP